MPISLYAIIGLLILNMITGGLWLNSKSNVESLENQLKLAIEAKKSQDITTEIKLVETNLVEKTCEQQLKDLQDSYDKARERNSQIDYILSTNRKSITNYETEVKTLNKKLKDKPIVITKIKEVIKKVPGPSKTIFVQPPTVTFEGLSENEKQIVKDYLSTPVPEFIADSLYIRGVRKDD